VPPPRRADARRNHDRLLAAARQVFDEQGPDAPLDAVARRAGVGNATVYRHFADRRELALAVYADEVTGLCARGEALLDDEAPDDALFAWLRDFVDHVATRRHLAEVEPGDGDRRTALFAAWHQAMHDTAGALVRRAREAATVRADLDAGDLLRLAAGIAVTDPAAAGRLLDLVRRGTTAP
jgi:AcrR family transcriptional regulator